MCKNCEKADKTYKKAIASAWKAREKENALASKAYAKATANCEDKKKCNKD